MRIMVTNDDGIDSVGLHVLARSLDDLGEVVVVAPDSDYSGSSAAFGALADMSPVMRRAEVAGIGESWTVAGPPALCAMFGRLGVFGGPFDLVVSGINPGANVGRAIYHSGTIGAAITARLGGVNAIAVSQEVDVGAVEGQALPGTIHNQRWDAAAQVAATMAKALLANLPADPVVLNINVPNLPLAEFKGWRRTSIAAAPTRAIISAALEPIDGDSAGYRGRFSWGDVIDLPPDTDGGAVEAGYVSITWLSRIIPDDPDGAGPAEESLAGLLDI